MKKFFILFTLCFFTACSNNPSNKVESPLTLEQIDAAEPLSKRNITINENGDNFGITIADNNDYKIFSYNDQYEIDAYVIGNKGIVRTKIDEKEAWFTSTITDSDFTFDETTGENLISFFNRILYPEVVGYKDGITEVKAKIKNQDIADDQDFTLYTYNMKGNGIECKVLIEYNQYTAPGIFFLGDIPEDFDYTIYSYEHEAKKILALKSEYDEDPSQFKYGTEFDLELLDSKTSKEIENYDITLKYNDDGKVIESSYTDMFGTTDTIYLYENVPEIKVDVPEKVLEISEDELFELLAVSVFGY